MLEPLEFLRGLEKIPLNEVNVYRHSQLKGRGIYAIFVETSDRIYIGSASKSFLRRFRQHRSRLKKGTHHTTGLQNAVNKHGLSCLTFAVVEVLDTLKREDILVCEQKWIDAIPPSIKLNICLVAGSPAGRPYSEDIKREQSVYMKALFKKEPERIQKMIDGTKEWMKDLANKENKRQQGVKAFSLNREKLAQSSRTPQRRAQSSLNTLKLWEREGHRELVSNTMKQEWANPETRRKRCESLKEALNTPQYKAQASKHSKKLFEDPEYRQKNKEHLRDITRKNAQKTGVRFKALWADDSYKEKVLQSMFFAQASKQNPSIIVSPDQIKYVTDSITRFAKEFNLGQTCLNKVVKGGAEHHKRWTGYRLDSWADVPNDAIRFLWGEHPDLPAQIEVKQRITPTQLSLDI